MIAPAVHQRPLPLSGLVPEAVPYRFSASAQLVLSSLVATLKAIAGVAALSRGLDAFTAVATVAASNLIWLPLALTFRHRQVSRRLAVFYGALSPLGGMAILVFPMLMVGEPAKLLLFILMCQAFGLATALLVHWLALAEDPASTSAPEA